MLTFNSDSVMQPGETMKVVCCPQAAFLGAQLVVPDEIAPSFVIADFSVGGKKQYAESGRIPARVFAKSSLGIRLMLPLAQPGDDVSLTVEHIGSEPMAFCATLRSHDEGRVS